MASPKHSLHYSVPSSARQVFERLLNNAWIKKYLPEEALEFSHQIGFSGDDEPSIPINWRFAESAAALKALEAVLVGVLMKRKHDLAFEGATIDTDHAQLFFMSCYLWTINHDSKNPISPTENLNALDNIIPNYNFHGRDSTAYRKMVTNIYKTADKRFFNLHGDLNPNHTLDMLGLPHDLAVSTSDEAAAIFVERVARLSSTELQHLTSDVYKTSGVICESVESFRATEHAKANSHLSLFEIHDYPSSVQGPTWWQNANCQESTKRPLAGLKVVDLSRIIAGPAIARGLAELGASVMRVTSPRLPDMHVLHIDLNWGKWNCSVDLTTATGRQELWKLLAEADVVVQGYRPGSLEKYGFGPHDILNMTKGRSRGIIVLRENCYGWYGPWSNRSGWQQISDSCVGVSHGFGKAMGLKDGESVTAVFPHSDYMTGVVGVSAILIALMKRAESGGSYLVDTALNYYNKWLVDCVGEYPVAIWEKLWARHGNVVFRSYDNPSTTVSRVLASMKRERGEVILNPFFFETRESSALKSKIKTVKPVIDFHGAVQLGYNIGTRGNGHDAPRWPQDLMTEEIN